MTRPTVSALLVLAGVVDRTRPLCAYPATARDSGTGSTGDAKNFRCEAP
jgi:hypothetical protein